MWASEDICAPMIQQAASPASSPPPVRNNLPAEVYTLSVTTFHGRGSTAKKNRDGTPVPSLFFISHIFPVRETGVNDRTYTSAGVHSPGSSGAHNIIYTSAGALSPTYFLCTSSYTSVIAFEGASVTLLTMTFTARLIRKAGSSS